MKLSMLLKDVEVLSAYNGDREVIKIAEKSNEATPNSLFIFTESGKPEYLSEARKNGALIISEKADGADITVENAVTARNIIWRNFYNSPNEKLSLFGVTGTNGKTTVTYLTRHIFENAGKKTGVIGTVCNITGDENSPSLQTTPGASELYRLFSKMNSNRLTEVCMEVSSHSLEQGRVDGLKFKAGAFTNLTRDHLDYHKTMKSYLESKLKFVSMCEGFAVNADDPNASFFIEEANKHNVKVLTYSLVSPFADLTAEKLFLTKEKTSFVVKLGEDEAKTEINIPGRFSVYNALTAISLAILAGIPLKDAAKHIASAEGIKGRMEKIKAKNGATVIIDYAHTPDGLEKVLLTLKDIKGKGKLITVFGCGGDRDSTKRPIMGKIAATYSDMVIVTSDNPRSENPYDIIGDIIKGSVGMKTPHLIIEDRKTAIKTAMSNAKQNDIVLLAGKGHETYQILKDKTINFDERDIIKAYI